jgi:16S rRNA processing protein RimM
MKFIPVGRVLSAHGVGGEVRFTYYNETGSAFPDYPSFFVDQAGAKIELKPSRVRRQGDAFIIKFKDLETVEKVNFLLKEELLVAEKDLPALDEGEYYDYELVGLEALTEHNRVVGTVKDVMHTRANDILVIEGPREVLVPMTEDHVVDIDTVSGFVRVREKALVE